MSRRRDRLDLGDGSLEGASVLLALGEPRLRRRASRILENEGARVIAVDDGAAALDEARSSRPDVVLADTEMEAPGGGSVLASLRSDVELDRLPVVLVYAPDPSPPAPDDVEPDADDYLTRPFRARELLARVRTQLRAARIRREVEDELELVLADTERLQQASSRLLPEGKIDALLDESLDLAIAVTRADMGTMQLLDPGTGVLKLLAWRGVGEEFVELFENVGWEDGSVCSAALKAGRRVIVNDVEASELVSAATPAGRALLQAGIGAAQSTPLVSRSGRVIGMLSTHWRGPHEPRARELHLLDLLVRQISDLIERHESEAVLRESERRLRELSRSLDERVTERTAALREQTRRLRSMAAELASAEQRERKRLATLLHDGLQQLLIAAKMHLGLTQSLVDDATARGELELASQRLDEAVEAARDLTRQLRPPVLYEAGLVPAVRWLATEMANRHRLRVAVDAESARKPLSDDIKAMLFEALRELLFNVAKYARVDEAQVRIREHDDGLHLVVEDAGLGFEPEALEESHNGGFGLFSIRERLAAVGGSMSVDSAPGRGTRVELVAPIAPAADRAWVLGEETFATMGTRQGVRQASGADRRPRVLVVDDHAIVREGIANTLTRDGSVVVVGEAADGLGAIEAVEEQRPDVVLVDVNMPRMNGVEATREIRRRWPDTAIVGLSVQDDAATAQSMLEAGAAAFVSKNGDSDEMIATILGVMKSPG